MTMKIEEIYEGDLEIRTDADAKKYKNITKVTGNLSIHNSTSAKMDALKSVGGHLSTQGSAKLDAPKLESVGGNLYIYIYSSGKLDASGLETVVGNLYIYTSAELEALKSAGGRLTINSTVRLDAPKLESLGTLNRLYGE